MSVENTQRTMEAYLEDLVGGGPYKRHFGERAKGGRHTTTH
jgi:hypothetical protein